jgi:pimeloyl-ACP methyl ester carboxylesterase
MHTFAVAQAFAVRLTARNRDGGATKSKTINVALSPSTCSTCVHIQGTITLGDTPIAPFADIRVQLVGQDTYSSALGDGGRFDVAAPPGDYSLQATLTYNDTVADPTLLYQKRTAVIRVPVHLPTTAVHELTFAPPVIFVHGIQSGPARWKSWATTLAPSGSPQMVAAVNYLDTDDYSTEAAAVAFQLRLLFSQLTVSLPKVRVIAHSKGGLVTRVLIGDNRDFAESIIDVIELGTPNIGTDCYRADIVRLLPAQYQFHLRPEDISSAIASNRLYDTFDDGRAVHAIAGTENLLENRYLEGLTPSVCSDSCALHGAQANDGVVPVASVARFDTTTSSRFIPTLLVPYHHEELGTDKTLYLLTSVIMPYYYQKRAFPSCGAVNDGCTGSSCGSGHGFSSTCNIVNPFSSMRMNTVSWYLPIAGLHDLPFGVSVSSTVGTPLACVGSAGAGALTDILGYRILRSGDPNFRDGGERIGFVGPPETSLPFSQSHFVDANPPSSQVYYAVVMVKRGNVPTPPVIGSGSSPRPRPSRP